MMRWKSKQVTTSTGRVVVKTVGGGRPMVILHGWGSSFAGWESAGKVLGEGYQVWWLALPGFGSTPEPKTAWGVSEYADWVAELVRKLGLDQAILLGHSNGGRIGMKLASRGPSWLERLVLVNSAGVPARNELKKKLFYYPAKLGKKLKNLPGFGRLYEPVRRLGYKLARESDYLTASPKMRLVMRQMLRYDARLDAGRIEVPVLLVWGERDVATPRYMGKNLHQVIPDSRLVVVPAATHGLPLKQPELVKQEIDNWLAEI